MAKKILRLFEGMYYGQKNHVCEEFLIILYNVYEAMLSKKLYTK